MTNEDGSLLEPIIKVEQLTHTYSINTPFERKALDSVDLDIYHGEYLGIIGQTGSGKSTLIQHLNGLLKPSSGQILFEGKDLWSSPQLTRSIRFQVGLVFQFPEYQLFEETVYKDIAFGPKNMNLEPDEIDRRVRRAAEFVELPSQLLERSPFELSGGQKRRVAIAGVIAMEPKVLILDEPTAGLDPASVESVLSNIEAYHRSNQATVIVVSHSMEEIARTADRMFVFNNGKIALSGTPHEVFAHSALLENLGLGVPQMTRVFSRIHAMGIDIDPSVYTIPQAKAAFLEAYRRRKEGL
jgi:energy-coupling factor transport system ATP-binding protein